MPKYDPTATAPTYEILSGDFPFEIVGVAKGISAGPKTNGSDCHDIKLQFYADATFTKPVSKFDEGLIDHPSCAWKYSVIAKCVGLQVPPGSDLAPDESWLGYRGWAKCEPKPGLKDPKKEWNSVLIFYTDKPKIAPRVIEKKSEEDVPF